MKKNIVIISVVLWALSLSGNSFAETKTDGDGWSFMLSPMFLWGKSINGTQQLGPASSDLDLNFTDDVLENLDAAFTIHFEAHKNDLTLFVDYQHAVLAPSVETPSGLTAGVELTDQVFETGLAYRVATFGINDLEVLGGARYISQDIELGLNSDPQLLDVSESWWDGFAGLRTFTHITNNLTFVGRADVGVGGSDITWNLSALIDYRFKNWGSVFGGYRWFDINYDSGDGMDRFVYDVTQQGPLAGLAFYW